MGIKQRLIEAMGGTVAAKATLTKPSWWNEIYGGNSGRDWEIADTPQGWLTASKNVWARNCIRSRAALVVAAPLKLYKYQDNGEEEEVPSHPVLDLLETVNPLTGDDKTGFMRGIAEQRGVFGRALPLKVRGTGRVMELYRLAVQYIRVEPSATEYIAGYVDTASGRLFPRDTVIDMRYPAIDGSVDAESPTSIALPYIIAYNALEAAARAMDKRGGRPGGIVSYDPGLLNIDADRLATEWDKRFSNPESAGRDAHMPAGTKYEGGAFSAHEQEREARRIGLAKAIMAAYSVPPALAGDFSDASILANAAVQSKTFWQLWGTDELRSISESLNRGLLWMEWPGTYDAGLYLKFDLSEIDALQEDANLRTERAVMLVNGGIASINEARKMVDLDAIADPGADEVVRVVNDKAPEDKSEEPQDAQQEPPPEPAPAKASPSLIPIFDPVGRTATDASGRVLGVIEAVKRFGEHHGVKATSATPVVLIAGKAFSASDVLVTWQESVKAEPTTVIVPAPVVNITNMQPAQAAPSVNVTTPDVTVNVPPQAPPVVNVAPAAVQVTTPDVTVNVPQQAAPVVNVELPASAREVQQVYRDKDGLITGTVTNVEYESAKPKE